MSLEEQLACGSKIDLLEGEFDSYYSKESSSNLTSLLRMVKVFLGDKKPYRNQLFRGTFLMGSDCLTMATLARLIVNRKGYEVQISRPDSIIYLFHATLIYEGLDNRPKVFKVTGNTIHEKYVPLSDSEVVRRLKLTKPLIDWFNSKVCKKY